MLKKFKRNYARPLPEILDGQDWEVRNSGNIHTAYVDFDKREFVVPFESSPGAELVRAHEAMHVKISPKKTGALNEADFVTLQSIEDCRVWHGLRMVGIKTENARVFSDKELEKFFKTDALKHPQRMADAAFAETGTIEESKVRELINQNDPSGGKILEAVDEVREKYFLSKEREDILPPWEDVVKAAKEITARIKELFPEMPPPPKCGGPGKEKQKGNVGNITESFVFGNDDTAEKIEIEALTAEEAEEAIEMGLCTASSVAKHKWEYSGKFADPGKLRPIQTPRLTTFIKFKTTNVVKQNASDEGIIPVRMNRYATDMRLFNRKGKRRAGAAILIDVSGSMSLSQEEIRQIIHQCPASIVAVYSGFRNDGILRIVAEKGRYSEELDEGMGRSNIVDVPAIEWLAKRKEGKKLWISDGWITCINEKTPHPEVTRKLTNTIRSAKIERVGNVRELLRSGKLIDKAFDDGHQVGRGYKDGSVI